MCNLYTIKASAAEVAAFFGVGSVAPFNAAAEVYPGYTGMVVREKDGARILEAMTWGFPLRTKDMKPEAKPKPVNNIATLESYMWRRIAPKPENRCLIPVTHFAEAEGAKGVKTRTWFSVKGQPIFAWAGMWASGTEWNDVYSGMMRNANDAIRPVHHRMPVLLLPEDHERWLRGSFDDVVGFRDREFPSELISMERTTDPWVKRLTASKSESAKAPSPPPQESLL